jgi:hypothetical protein
MKAVQQLGLHQAINYAWYRFGLWSGYLRRETDRAVSAARSASSQVEFELNLPVPDSRMIREILGEGGLQELVDRAEEIVKGSAAGLAAPAAGQPGMDNENLPHWTEVEYPGAGAGGREGESGSLPAEDPALDIRYIWESGRLGWAYSLVRAYQVNSNDRYVACFWQLVEAFLDSNPPNLGLHWVSAQEVALRLITLCFAGNIFRNSPLSTPERRKFLCSAVADHAARIPPTLSYARAQNNNHLLSEAAGLYTAGCALPGHPSAQFWRELGWRLFNQGLFDQIAEDGTYIQHSTNYHRLMLQLALWLKTLARTRQQKFPARVTARLQSATHWLSAVLDSDTGQVPNLGPNDGSNIFPLSNCASPDYRPVLQAAGSSFLHTRLLKGAGAWDEMMLWFSQDGDHSLQDKHVEATGANLQSSEAVWQTPHILRYPEGDSWAYFRIARFKSRPGHADQLHLDLWWQGYNLAADPGTFLYNAGPPWNNTLRYTAVHNTVTVNGKDQMTAAGRFLYLDWAQAEIIAGEQAGNGCWRTLIAEHDGYRRDGVTHRRSVVAGAGTWLIQDTLSSMKPSQGSVSAPITVSLHWLLPDWSWEMNGSSIVLGSPEGPIRLDIEQGAQTDSLAASLVRAGRLLHGPGPAKPFWGWTSPAYGEKVPALSFSVSATGDLPICLTSRWVFPG